MHHPDKQSGSRLTKTLYAFIGGLIILYAGAGSGGLAGDTTDHTKRI